MEKGLLVGLKERQGRTWLNLLDKTLLSLTGDIFEKPLNATSMPSVKEVIFGYCSLCVAQELRTSHFQKVGPQCVI